MAKKTKSQDNLEALELIENNSKIKEARDTVKWIDEKEIQNKDGVIVGYKPLKTTANYKCLLNNLNIKLTTNVFTKEVSFNDDSHLSHYLEGSDKIDALWHSFTDELIRFNLTEQRNTVLSFLTLEASKNEVNPIADWLNDLPAESDTEYLEAFIKDVYRLQESSQDVTDKKQALIKKWFLQAVAATLSTNEYDVFPTVLTFTGSQGAGKTTFASRILPESVSNYIKTGAAGIDLANKDDIAKITSAFIVELGELSSTFKRSNVDAIKAFLSSPMDEYRAPYARAAEKFKRRTVFISSNNNADFLVDKTGNRRFLCVTLSNERSEFWWEKWDLNRVWAQAKFMFDSGIDWALTSEENKFLSEENENSLVMNPMAEAIESTFSLDISKEISDNVNSLNKVKERFPECVYALCVNEVFNMLFPSAYGDIKTPNRADAKAIRHFLLSNLGENRCMRVNGTVKRAWRLVNLSGKNDSVYTEIIKIIEDSKKLKTEGPF